MGSLLVTGPPGSGKSTIASTAGARMERSVLVEGDWFFGFIATGAIDPWLPAAHAQNTIVTEAAAACTGRFAADYDTIFDGVIGQWFLGTFLAASGLTELDYVVLLPDVETCVERVASRVGHGFTDEAATRKMHAEFRAASIGAGHVVDSSVGTVDDVLDEVLARRVSGRLRYSV